MLSTDGALTIARKIVARDNAVHQTFNIDKRYYLGPAIYSIMGTHAQFVEWCATILSEEKPDTQSDIFRVLLSLGVDQYSLCRALGFSNRDFPDICTGKLKVELPF